MKTLKIYFNILLISIKTGINTYKVKKSELNIKKSYKLKIRYMNPNNNNFEYFNHLSIDGLSDYLLRIITNEPYVLKPDSLLIILKEENKNEKHN